MASPYKLPLVDGTTPAERGSAASAIRNARAFNGVRREFGTFARYLWEFVDGAPVQNRRRSLKQVPARTAMSDALSRDLEARGFNFVGSTIMYAFMQATGMVNDHVVDCFRHGQVKRESEK